MANTYFLIASQTLASTSASVTFSSIPNTFTDLVLRASVKNNAAAQSEQMRMRVNGNTASVYSNLTHSHEPGLAVFTNNLISGFENTLRHSGATTNAASFATIEIYIPSYLVSQHKPLLATSSLTGNTDGGNYYSVGQVQDNNPITSILLYNSSANVFAVGSSFYLYGISNE